MASLPLLALVGGIVTLAATPAALALSRWQEREADRFGLEITRDNPAAARAFVRLQEENLAVPRTGLLFRLWRGSHPDLADRIEFANRYSPWARGEPLRYGDRSARRSRRPRPDASCTRAASRQAPGLLVLQAGAVLVVLAALPYHRFSARPLHLLEGAGAAERRARRGAARARSRRAG